MLDPWIIEEIRRREERQWREERPVLDIPLMPPPDSEAEATKEETEERGVVIVDFCV
ncbi:MAG: hypothetical protein IT371_18150 [Deltaproteobacteria bacterium]|nr:hypothetical protein [Deltaproteobacteria bacterium]